ncbi:MAG: hypothetical protein HYX75_11335 [Acidobacteria bacterium]|nr:hypothetical protein [Acidobacteriota bacterium]
MKCLMSALCLLSFLAASAGSGEPPSGLSYSIQADIDARAKVVRAKATVALPSTSVTDAREVSLDLKSSGTTPDGRPQLTIQRVYLPGWQRDASMKEADGVLRVQIPQGVSLPSVIQLLIEYSIPFDSDSLKNYGYYLYSMWYPDVVSSGGAEMRFRDFSVSMSYPVSFTVLTTGAREGSSTERAGIKTEQFVAPHVEGFALGFGEGFVLTPMERGGTRVIAFCQPELAATYRTIAEASLDAISWYRETYGFSPLRQIGILQGPKQWAGGYPMPNMFMVHRGRLDRDFIEWITAHEVGHYYWGLYVLGDTEDLDWLELANGIWADQLYMARKRGRSLDEQWRSDDAGDWYVDFVRGMIGNHEQRLGITEEEETALDFDYNSLVRHAKGAVGLFLQARRIGSEKFLALQRQILNEYAHRPLPVSEFVERLEKAGAAGAGEFFKKWKRADATIAYAAELVEVTPDPDGVTCKISVARQGTIPYPVSVEVRDTAGQAIRKELPGVESEETFEVTLSTAPSEICLDSDGILPMWNSSHAGIRRVFLRALYSESLTEPFVQLAPLYLTEHPDDARIRMTLAAAHFDRRRYADVIALLESKLDAPCSYRVGCMSAMYLARALGQVGRRSDAAALLASVRDASEKEGLHDRWTAAEKELGMAEPGRRSER